MQTDRQANWPWQDFRESFSESCGDLAKGRKSTKVAGGARASGYSIVQASKILRFQAQKSPIPSKIARCTRHEAGPTPQKSKFLSRTTQKMKTPPK